MVLHGRLSGIIDSLPVTRLPLFAALPIYVARVSLCMLRVLKKTVHSGSVSNDASYLLFVSLSAALLSTAADGGGSGGVGGKAPKGETLQMRCTTRLMDIVGTAQDEQQAVSSDSYVLARSLIEHWWNTAVVDGEKTREAAGYVLSLLK